MLSHAQPLKRRRSPSPTAYDQQHDNAFTSPLDVLIKRRRKRQTSGYFDDHHNSHDDGDGNDGGPMQDQLEHKEHAGEEGTVGGGGGGSASITTTTSTPYVDKRRTRQWDRLNAGARPSLPAASGSGSGGHAYSQPHFEHTPPHASTFTRAHSFPALPNQNGNGHSHHSSSGGFPSSPPHAISQPLPQNQMSSSPIRHQVYGSSPFKSSAPTNLAPPFNGTEMSSGSATRVEGSAGRQEHEEMDEEMDPDELRRGWGEQYAQQNELLHSLHRQRAWHQHQASPDPSLLQTPLQYRDSYFGSGSSPQHPPSSVRTHRSGDSSMFVEVEAHTPPMFTMEHPEAAARYEEANRLLAELEVVRRNRWGH